jgi:hypothetical protein
MRAHLSHNLPKGLTPLIGQTLKRLYTANLNRNIEDVPYLIYFGGELLFRALILSFKLLAERKTLLFCYCDLPLLFREVLLQNFGIERVKFTVVDEPIRVFGNFRDEML